MAYISIEVTDTLRAAIAQKVQERQAAINRVAAILENYACNHEDYSALNVAQEIVELVRGELKP